MSKHNDEDQTLPILSLADQNTAEGAMERTFLAETLSPEDSNYNPEIDLEAMRDMRQALENRLKSPGSYLAPRATNVIGIITAPGQFPELSNYPHVP